ncbi:MAG TPA: nuclear transport factor 2 family protein [Candidatus Binatia bacterium]
MEAWNAHDLNRILALYTPDARHTSKRVRALGGENDTLHGKQAIAEYFGLALERYPALRFEPISVSTGPRTVAIEYQSQHTGSNEPTLELLELNGAGLIIHSRVYHGP